MCDKKLGRLKSSTPANTPIGWPLLPQIGTASTTTGVPVSMKGSLTTLRPAKAAWIKLSPP